MHYLSIFLLIYIEMNKWTFEPHVPLRGPPNSNIYLLFVFLFMCLFPVLFTDAVSISDYVISNDRKGRAIVQVVSHWLPTSAARVRAQVRSCGTCHIRKETGAGFLWVLQFPLPILIPTTAPHSSIIRGWYNSSVRGRRTKRTEVSPPSQKTKKKSTDGMNNDWWNQRNLEGSGRDLISVTFLAFGWKD
jgi:hypothetical protein